MAFDIRHSSFLAFFAFATLAHAQNAPHIGYVYPAGGRQGTTFQVKVGGQYLGSVSNAYVSGDGVQGVVVEYNRPMTQKEFNDLREKLRSLQKRRTAARGEPNSTNVWTAADEMLIAEIRAKMLKSPPNRQGNQAIAETVTLRVTINPDANPGERELRLKTLNGLSNPLQFCVGLLPEFRKSESQSISGPGGRRPVQRNPNQQGAVQATETSITLPANVNGQILPGGVDRYRFQARAGQHLVAVVSARELIPYLADAVPGWFQATLALYDAQGNELAYDDDYRFNPDPVIHFEVPKDGQYVIEIKDAIYRGREDFVYRIAIGELPFVTSIFPLGGPANTSTTVELKGWNLPADRLVTDATRPGIQLLSVRNGEHVSNLAPFEVDNMPQCVEQESNDTLETAQRVTLPTIVNGRIDSPGDADEFRFEGRSGDEIVAEVNARRLNSPLDSVLRLTDAAGKQIAFNDDTEDKGAGLETHHADSCLVATLPADGTYYMRLADVQQHGGGEYGYRLRISAPQPDFALRIVPSCINSRAGMSVPVTVYALRKDGFTNEIEVRLKEAPAGFGLSGGLVPAGQDQIRLTLAVPPVPREEPYSLSLEGVAVIRGNTVVRQAVPADDMMQAFAYRHLVPAKELLVAVTGRGSARPSPKILGDHSVEIPVGGTARVQIGPSGRQFTNNFRLELSEPPEGITIKEVLPGLRGATIVLQSDANKVEPGQQGNLIINLFGITSLPAGRRSGQMNRPRNPVGTLPAIPFQIVSSE